MLNKNPHNRRHYIRLDTVFPVQFCLIGSDEKALVSEWLQGFTNNIGKGGICLEINNLKPESAELIRQQRIKISIKIELPITKKLIPAIGTVIWVKNYPGREDKYLVGLSYERIDALENKKIMRYARMKRVFLPSVILLIFLLVLGLGLGSYLNMKLIKGNKLLVSQLVAIVQDSSVAKQKVKEINRQREELELQIQVLIARINTAEGEKNNLGESSRTEKVKSEKKIAELSGIVSGLAQEKNLLQEKMIVLQRKESLITDDLLRIDRKKASLEKANLSNMYQWLKVHQNPRTGLAMSFEGDTDMKDIGFVYDQSLVLQAYTYFSDYDRARKILDFFVSRAEKVKGFYYNAYYVTDGSPAEFTIHCGPNIWLGIGILQYTKKTSDRSYLDMAQSIARACMALQDQDADGGLRGGPDIVWYATEHNLDAYVFFDMLSTLTGKEEYARSRDRILAWLLKHTYGKSDIPIKRGKGDSTIATDTYAWSIAAIKPKKLLAIGMNPDRIMEFAEELCAKEVVFRRPEGYSVRIKGFDFAPERNLARGGVVSPEWTAQMVISFQIMADYYYGLGLKAKAHFYEVKADEYLAAIGKMTISSPSPSGQGESCLPYANEERVDTGHGWMTPKGNSTGSIAGTAYALFAFYSYNPLAFNE